MKVFNGDILKHWSQEFEITIFCSFLDSLDNGNMNTKTEISNTGKIYTMSTILVGLHLNEALKIFTMMITLWMTEIINPNT